MPDSWSSDAAAAAALLGILVRDMEQRSDWEEEAVLAELLSVAWPSHLALRQ